MLIFKNNLYNINEQGPSGFYRSPDAGFDLNFDPAQFVQAALQEEEDTLDFLERQPSEYWKDDADKFFPIAQKTGGLPVLKNILAILAKGHEDTSCWYHMNAYHFCFLYDVLGRFAFNYNHDSHEERIKQLASLAGKPIYYDIFIKNYFFNTAFLVSEDEFDAMTREDKQKKGGDDPCMFAVVHGLAPTRDELKLKQSRDYPYSIFV